MHLLDQNFLDMALSLVLTVFSWPLVFAQEIDGFIFHRCSDKDCQYCTHEVHPLNQCFHHVGFDFSARCVESPDAPSVVTQYDEPVGFYDLYPQDTQCITRSSTFAVYEHCHITSKRSMRSTYSECGSISFFYPFLLFPFLSYVRRAGFGDLGMS